MAIRPLRNVAVRCRFHGDVIARSAATWQSRPLAMTPFGAIPRVSLRGAKRRGNPSPRNNTVRCGSPRVIARSGNPSPRNDTVRCDSPRVIARSAATWQSGPLHHDIVRFGSLRVSLRGAQRRGNPVPFALSPFDAISPWRVIARSAATWQSGPLRNVAVRCDFTACHCEERSDVAIWPPSQCRRSMRFHGVSLRGAQRRGNPVPFAMSPFDAISRRVIARSAATWQSGPPRNVAVRCDFPACHCEERSDVAIRSPSQCRRSMRVPRVSLRGAQRRGNPSPSQCRRSMRFPGMSLRGAQRRGNRSPSQCRRSMRFPACHCEAQRTWQSGPPRNVAVRCDFTACHCEEHSDVAIRSPFPKTRPARRLRTARSIGPAVFSSRNQPQKRELPLIWRSWASIIFLTMLPPMWPASLAEMLPL